MYTKKSLLDWYKDTRSFFVKDDFIKLYLDCPRDLLLDRIKKHLDKKLNKDQTIELMVIKTRQYAKRQATWARGQMKNWKTLNPQDVKFSLKKLFN